MTGRSRSILSHWSEGSLHGEDTCFYLPRLIIKRTADSSSVSFLLPQIGWVLHHVNWSICYLSFEVQVGPNSEIHHKNVFGFYEKRLESLKLTFLLNFSRVAMWCWSPCWNRHLAELALQVLIPQSFIYMKLTLCRDFYWKLLCLKTCYRYVY